jgi:hypothetical protein
MPLELIVAPLIIAFLLVAALGHVLLAAAIYKCLQEDHVGGRGRGAAARNTPIVDNDAARAAGTAGFIETIHATKA